MPSRALTVAMAAGALLVAVVAADATMNRTYKLEAYLDGRWILVASTPEDVMTREFPSLVPLPLNASDDVSFRLSAHNGYPWSLSKDFDLTVGGVSVQRGALDASSFQDDREEFTVPASALMTQGAGFPAEKPPPGNERFWSPQILLEVDGETLYGSVAFREVAR